MELAKTRVGILRDNVRNVSKYLLSKDTRRLQNKGYCEDCLLKTFGVFEPHLNRYRHQAVIFPQEPSHQHDPEVRHTGTSDPSIALTAEPILVEEIS